MPLTLVADSLDEIPEPLRAAAKQEGAKFAVGQLPAGFAVENVQGLRTTLQTLRSEKKQLEDELRPFRDAGVDAADLPAAMEALSLQKAGKLKSAADIDAWKSEVAKKFEEEKSRLGEKLSKRTQALRDQLVAGKLAPIIAAKGGSEAMEAILTLAQRNIRVDEDAEGNLVPVVVGNDGKTALVTKKSGSTDPMGFDELIDVMREASATKGLFRAPAAGGSGSTSQSAGGGQTGNQDSSKLSAKELLIRGHTAGARAGTA